MQHINAPEYIDRLRGAGISAFTSEKFQSELVLSKAATTLALWRLRNKNRIATPIAGYHLIVPPEYRSLGSLPANQFIDGLMNHLSEPYYVALLSAAEIHGAAHQRPQVFQVMVSRKRKPIQSGEVRIEFCVRNNLTKIPTVTHKVPTGYLKVSTPEATAFDLIGYINRAAGLDNVATILSELEESLDENMLVEVACSSPLPWAQRLGCLLDLLGKGTKLYKLEEYTKSQAPKVVALAPWKSMKGSARNKRWKIALNEFFEAD